MSVLNKYLTVSKENADDALLEEGINMVDDGITDMVLETGVGITTAVDEEKANMERLQNAIVSAESICTLIERLINNNTTSLESAKIINTELNSFYSRYGFENETISVESYSDDIIKYHEITLEGIRNVAWGLWQSCVVLWRRWIDTIMDDCRNTDALIYKYRKYLYDYKKIADSKFKGIDSNAEFKDMDNTYLHYILGDISKGTAALPDFKKELELSKYVVNIYPKIVFDNLLKLESIVTSGNFSTAETINSTVISKMKQIKKPIDLFDDKYSIDSSKFKFAEFTDMGYSRYVKDNENKIPKVKLVRSKFMKTVDGFRVIPIVGAAIFPIYGTLDILHSVFPGHKMTIKDLYGKMDAANKYIDVIEIGNNFFKDNMVTLDALVNKLELISKQPLSDKESKIQVSHLLGLFKEHMVVLYPFYKDNLGRMERILRGMYYFIVYSIKRFDV